MIATEIFVYHMDPICLSQSPSRKTHTEICGMAEQLAQKYTHGLRCDGYGIYVVFWFGADRKYMKVVPPEGGIPQKPSELKDRLHQRLTPDLRRRIHLVVIDVAPQIDSYPSKRREFYR